MLCSWTFFWRTWARILDLMFPTLGYKEYPWVSLHILVYITANISYTCHLLLHCKLIDLSWMTYCHWLKSLEPLKAWKFLLWLHLSFNYLQENKRFSIGDRSLTFFGLFQDIFEWKQSKISKFYRLVLLSNSFWRKWMLWKKWWLHQQYLLLHYLPFLGLVLEILS